MSIALIDNSTLSSVQRVLGLIPIKSKNSIDGDLTAFESFISAILFYNDRIALNDYKPEFADARIRFFNFIDFINPKDFNGNEITNISQKENSEFMPIIKGGKFADDAFKTFFDILRVNIQCTWDVSSSIYYLTLKMLGEQGGYEFEKYGKICHTIFSELNDAKNDNSQLKSDVALVDRYGNPIDKDYKIPEAKWGDGSTGGLTSGLRAFIGALSWLSYKSIYYSNYADYLMADTFIHPIRQNFQMYYYDKKQNFQSNYIREIIRGLDKFAHDEYSTILNQNRSFSISHDYPHFLTYIISKVNDPKKIIEYAFEMREKQVFLRAREALGNIRILFEQSEMSKASREIAVIKNDLQGVFNEIRREYGVATTNGDLFSRSVNTYNAASGSLKLPRLPDEIKQSRIANLISQLTNRKAFSIIYRNISTELLNIQKLGKYHDLLTSKVEIIKDSAVYQPRTESPEYVNAHSKWKSPM